MVVPLLPSDDVHVYWVIALPPFAGAFQETVSVVDPAVFGAAEGDGEDTVGGFIVAGTVVTVTADDAEDIADVPEAFDAVTVNVGDDPVVNPVTTIGEDEPDADCPVEAVTVYDVAAGEFAGSENDTDTAPLL